MMAPYFKVESYIRNQFGGVHLCFSTFSDQNKKLVMRLALQLFSSSNSKHLKLGISFLQCPRHKDWGSQPGFYLVSFSFDAARIGIWFKI